MVLICIFLVIDDVESFTCLMCLFSLPKDSYKFLVPIFLFLFVSMVEIELKALYTQGKHSIPEIYFQPWGFLSQCSYKTES